LREIDVDAVVVYEDALHFEIGLFAGCLFAVFDEGILEGVAGAFVADYFAGEDFAEAGED
jgi:hypothetical protein